MKAWITIFAFLVGTAYAEHENTPPRPVASPVTADSLLAHRGHPCRVHRHQALTGPHLPSQASELRSQSQAFLELQRNYCSASVGPFREAHGIRRIVAIPSARFGNYEEALVTCLGKGYTLPSPEISSRLRPMLGCFLGATDLEAICQTRVERGGRTFWTAAQSITPPESGRELQRLGREGILNVAQGSYALRSEGYWTSSPTQQSAILCARYEDGAEPENDFRLASCYARLMHETLSAIASRRWTLDRLNPVAIRQAIDTARSRLLPPSQLGGNFERDNRLGRSSPPHNPTLCDLANQEVSAIERLVMVKLLETRDHARWAEGERERNERAHGTLAPSGTDAEFQALMDRYRRGQTFWNNGERAFSVLYAIFYPGNLLDEAATLAMPFAGALQARRDARQGWAEHIRILSGGSAPGGRSQASGSHTRINRRQSRMSQAQLRELPAPNQQRFEHLRPYRLDLENAGGSGRTVQLRATIMIMGKVLILSHVSIHEQGQNFNSRVPMGLTAVRSVIDQLAQQAREAGFEMLVIRGYRVTGSRSYNAPMTAHPRIIDNTADQDIEIYLKPPGGNAGQEPQQTR